MTQEPINKREELERQRQQEALRTIDRVTRDSEALANSNLARAASNYSKSNADRALDKALEKIGADNDIDPNDPIEIWGTRIGRAGGAIFAVILVLWLINHFTR